MSDYKLTEYLDREILQELTVSHPALAGISVKGFLLSEDRRACIVFEPIQEDK